MPIGAIIGGVASIGGSILSSRSQSRAARRAQQTATQTAQMNNDLATRIYDQNAAALTPFQTRGNAAGEQMNAMLGLAGQGAQNNAFNTFKGSTGYDFRFNEGMRALDASAPVLNSGSRLKALQNYGQNIASNEFGNYMGYLANQQGVGLSGASAQAGVGQNFVNTVSGNNNSAGTAIANSQLMRGQSNANMWGGIAGGLGSIFGSSFGR